MLSFDKGFGIGSILPPAAIQTKRHFSMNLNEAALMNVLHSTFSFKRLQFRDIGFTPCLGLDQLLVFEVKGHG